jgi:hypothetical protein
MNLSNLMASWEANSHPAGQELPRILCSQKVNYRVHKGPPLIPILNQMNQSMNEPTYYHTLSSLIPLPQLDMNLNPSSTAL